MTKQIVRFDSFEELLDEAEREPVWKYYRSSHQTLYGKSWSGTDTFGEAIEIARRGWPEGRSSLVSGVEAANIVRKPTLHRSRGYDVAGSTPDVARYISGDPECMITFPHDAEAAHRPIIRMVINAFLSASVSPEAALNRGAAILSHLDRLEEEGHQVEFDMCLACKMGTYQFRVWYPLKRAGEPIEFDRLAFALMHPSMFRRVLFAIFERQPIEMERVFGSSYGMPDELTLEELGANTVYFGNIWTNTEREYLTIGKSLETVKGLIEGSLSKANEVEMATWK